MPKSVFLFIPAIFIVLLLAAISGKYQLTPKSPQDLPTITSAPSLFHEPPWQIYQNNDYGLTIEYPANRKVVGALLPDAGNSVSFIPPQGSFIVLSVATDDSQSIVDYLSKKDNEFRKNNNGRSFEKVLSIEEAVVGGYLTVKRREYWETSNFETYVTYFKHNQAFISIYLFPPHDSNQKISQSEKEIYNQILSTIKFVDQ